VLLARQHPSGCDHAAPAWKRGRRASHAPAAPTSTQLAIAASSRGRAVAKTAVDRQGKPYVEGRIGRCSTYALFAPPPPPPPAPPPTPPPPPPPPPPPRAKTPMAPAKTRGPVDKRTQPNNKRARTIVRSQPSTAIHRPASAASTCLCLLPFHTPSSAGDPTRRSSYQVLNQQWRGGAGAVAHEFVDGGDRARRAALDAQSPFKPRAEQRGTSTACVDVAVVQSVAASPKKRCPAMEAKR
jgi:hypothetical protein